MEILLLMLLPLFALLGPGGGNGDDDDALAADAKDQATDRSISDDPMTQHEDDPALMHDGDDDLPGGTKPDQLAGNDASDVASRLDLVPPGAGVAAYSVYTFAGGDPVVIDDYLPSEPLIFQTSGQLDTLSIDITDDPANAQTLIRLEGETVLVLQNIAASSVNPANIMLRGIHGP